MNRVFDFIHALDARSGAVLAGIVFLVSAGVPISLQAQQDSSQTAAARTLLQQGQYEQARDLYEHEVGSETVDQASFVTGYAETFLQVGAYQSGLERISNLLENYPENPYLLYARGQLLESIGEYSSARGAYSRAMAQAPQFWPNVLALSELLQETGQRAEARKLQIRIYRAYQQGEFRTAETLSIAARAGAALQQFHEANDAFRQATKINSSHIQTLYWWAELFRQKYNKADAERTYNDALSINPRHAGSYVGLAQTTDNFRQKEKLARQALEINPKSVGAHNILGELRILDGQYAEADSILQAALDINPSSTTTLASLASIYYLQGDSTSFDEVEQRALRINNRNGAFYLTIVDNIVRRFRYPAAIRFARRALETNPNDWQAYATLGTSLLRMGLAEEARQYLEISFDRDPFNLFVGNTLTLLDEREQFARLESEHFRLLIHPSEQHVLGPSILEWAETAYDSLSTRYPYRPSEKILLEAYNESDDFAVRVAGVPHIGLLGVAFGDVVALTTPQARPDQPFNWTRTLWHEIAHTMAIGISEHQVPRWFTEGLSVYEERRARPRWDREMELKLFAAYEQDRLLPLEEIDKGFTRPEFPGQIMLTYYHSSEVVEFIVDRHGFEAVIDILERLSEGHPIEEAIEQSINQTIETLDYNFRAALDDEKSRFADALENLPGMPQDQPADASWLEQYSSSGDNPFLTHLQEGHEALEQGNFAEAESAFRQALDIYPYYIGQRNAYQGLAEVYQSQEREQELINILEEYLSISEFGASEARELAVLYLERENIEQAIHYLNRSLETEPYHKPTRTSLAELYRSSDRFDAAIEERRAVLNLDPVNEAEAHYQLAVDLYLSDRVTDAKDAVVRALEIAPGYAEAQSLLLKCVSTTQNTE